LLFITETGTNRKHRVAQEYFAMAKMIFVNLPVTDVAGPPPSIVA
jgi:hypothetical protein